MCVKTTRYEELSKRINKIITTCSVDVDMLNPPSTEQEDSIRAMILLCHAEFEDYIEYLAEQLLDCGEELWEKKQIANKNIACLFLNSEKFKKDVNGKTMTMDTYSRKAISDFRKMIQEGNHGIKSRNIANMYEPLGYSLENFNAMFLSELDSFGTNRGSIAHTTASKMKSPFVFNDEKEKILRILSDIEEFEHTL